MTTDILGVARVAAWSLERSSCFKVLCLTPSNFVHLKGKAGQMLRELVRTRKYLPSFDNVLIFMEREGKRVGDC